MPYILIQVTKEDVTVQQKQMLIKEATDLVVRILNKEATKTFVVIEEVDMDNWGVAGESVRTMRERHILQGK